jgi:transposase
MARPTKLTPEVEERLVQAISVGATFKDACAHAGISFQTLQNWKKRARRAAEQAGEPDGEPEEDTDQFVEFFDRIKKAEADAAVGWLTTINKAARRDWKAGAWMLERRYPGSYDRNRLRPDRIDEVAPTLTTAPTPALDKDGAEEILRIMRKYGLLPPDEQD